MFETGCHLVLSHNSKNKSTMNIILMNSSVHLPDITGRTALAVRPDVVNAKYHVITNTTYNRDPVPAKFKHVTNIDTCTLLCCDYSTLWEALHVNMVEIGVLAFLTKTSKFSFHINGSAEKDERKWSVSS